MTRDEFFQKYRGRMLLYLTEAWAARKEAPSDLGFLLDKHTRGLRQLLDDIYDDFHPKQPQNGQPLTERKP